MTATSDVGATLDRLARRSAQAVVARARLAHPSLNAVLMSRLAAAPGQSSAMFADPVFEMAKSWEPADRPMGELEDRLLTPKLISALDTPDGQRMPRDQRPYAHQVAAWEASLVEGKSVMVTAGTGSGKTEAFLIPVLQDILTHPRPGGGVQAILLYPLNALIESQRERLSAWAQALGGRLRFALYNGDTPETERQARIRSDEVELRSRRAIRERPPEILVTNITMLEYLLLRAQDQKILDASQGALRWIVLDEAHSYIGSQAAEMALLLRRVRAAFGVAPGDVRLMATSATIGGEADAPEKLRAFAAALSGRTEADTAVIEGREATPTLPAPGRDRPIDVTALAELDPAGLWADLADHPRTLALRRQMGTGAVTLPEAARILFDDPAHRADAEAVLNAAAIAEQDGHRLIPWRVHFFHRAQGGVWVCVNPGCEARDPELAAHEADWPWGAVHLTPRARCTCGGPVYELVGCDECGQIHLEGRLVAGAVPRLEPPDPGEADDFALDAEPDESVSVAMEAGTAWIAPGSGNWIDAEGRIYDNAAPEDRVAWQVRLIERAAERGCCDGADRARLAPLRFGPAFFMGNALPVALEALTEPLEQAGLPAGGRRALTFSDSRQGVARLAAKLQQEAERTLTRAYLWHAVQEGSKADPAEIAKIDAQIAQLEGNDLFADMVADLHRRRAAHAGEPTLVPWAKLVERFTQQVDLREFAGEVWRSRKLGREMADDPKKIAEMFLYRELFRRPRVQNNPETMGLMRLSFPKLEAKATGMAVPRPLAEAGVESADWMGLALAAVDFIFRNYLAIDLPDWLVPLISPRFGALNFVVPAGTPSTERRTSNTRAWPGPVPTARPNRLHRLVYGLIGGSWEDPVDQDRAAEVLDALWNLVTTTATTNMGAGAHRLDFTQAAVVRLDRAWLCPVTRRPFGYHVAGRTPYDATKPMVEVAIPRLPVANAGGLTPSERDSIAYWCESDPEIRALRSRGLWTDLHDRIATYPPFLRAQEHSAQISRSVLARYEEAFREGRINFLNCSTTMEMGVDIPAVGLVVNANVPPSLSNYRQRVGRAGRRGEPWAFALTFCRDLPLDRQAFTRPKDFLARPIVAPKVRFDSPSIIQRHINAALLADWLAEKGGINVRGSIGAFLGAGQALGEIDESKALADDFLADLRGEWGVTQSREDLLQPLLDGTVLAGRPLAGLVADAADAFDSLVKRWREEHRTLLDGAANASEAEVRKSYELRARRFAGEFLLGELARRGFTPAYGFPTDVVTFDPLSGQFGEEEVNGFSYRSRGGAARELHLAIREYAPGAEVVIDGLVYESEGVLPAWGADADASRLEDLREMWICRNCQAFGQTSVRVATCPVCANPRLDHRRVLRPAGFLSRKRPHTGYEAISHVPPEPVRLSAQEAEWIALPHEEAGRMRADAAGQVATAAAGPRGGGYAICLDCGRAAPMGAPQHDTAEPLPDSIRRHYPLHRGKGTKLTRDGLCAGSDAPHRIQRHVHLAQVTQTDVWEWQLPPGSTESTARAFAAGLREALCERMGVEPTEIGPAAGRSRGPAGEDHISVFLYDRAAGGAGLVARIAEPEMLVATIERAAELLDCPEGCLRGCPACILRPDINQRDIAPDRPSALALARGLKIRVNLPVELRLFGPETRLVGRPLAREIEQSLTAGRLKAIEVWLHGDPGSWDLGGWPVARMLPRLGQAGIAATVHIPKAVLASAEFDLACKLALHRIAAFARLMLVGEPPQASGKPLLALLRSGETVRTIAVTRAEESLPDSSWGVGAAGPVLVGPAPELPSTTELSAEKLMQHGTGNARVLWPGGALDGPVAGFGRRFWEWLAREAPFEVVAMRDIGVKRISYSDRYMLTPLTLRLLTAVVRAAPGAKKADFEICLAMADRPVSNPKFVYDNFPADGDREALGRELLPSATVTIRRKSDLPHRRTFEIDLSDGRRLVLLLDQGFGAWRANGAVRHDFRSGSARQAHALIHAEFSVHSHDVSDAPMALTWI